MGAMSFDFGMSHIGVATIELTTSSVQPTTTIKAKKGRPSIEQLDLLLNTWKPTQLIVGLPLNMDDSESPMSKASRKFGKFLERRFSLPVHFVDERLTTIESKSRTSNAHSDHAIAACAIGESWLHELCVDKDRGGRDS
ncbi:MAG: Holliday junction resolvase RuvX [Gammaproteobacteria bacterium]|nr:Holliday junction resolvase RuvX [Gammaproteobacteria bacterium]MYD80914.1 Holliday junction resolvase RuvX [Gammaproteobacteria bacterium]